MYTQSAAFLSDEGFPALRVLRWMRFTLLCGAAWIQELALHADRIGKTRPGDLIFAKEHQAQLI